MKTHLRFCLVATALVGLTMSPHTLGQAAKPATPKPWNEIAKEQGLSEADIAQLEKNRILVSNETYKQIFTPYIENNLPVFITSDSLLNAYHVLYEESIFRMERSMASRLPEILRQILQNIDATDDHMRGNPELAAAALKRAKLVAGIAMRLVDDTTRFNDKELDAIVEVETKTIIEAKAVQLPKWLGKPGDPFQAIDYSRYLPRGFYTRNESMQRYFRAISWLQSIPFRADRDEELVAILMLGATLKFDENDQYAFDASHHAFYGRNLSDQLEEFARSQKVTFFRAYNFFIGPGDDLDLMVAASKTKMGVNMDLGGNDLEKVRQWLVKFIKEYEQKSMINDHIGTGTDSQSTKNLPAFRVISAYRTPDSVLFHRTTSPLGRGYPNGLEVATVLGSSLAREELAKIESPELLKILDSRLPHNRSLYTQYLDVLRTLVDAPEPDAPDCMKTKAWEAKSCNTILGGWAQLRHTWALQAKQAAYAPCVTGGLRSFVEPEPEFYGQMARLAKQSKEVLQTSGAFERNLLEAIAFLEDYLKHMKGVTSLAGYRSQARRYWANPANKGKVDILHSLTEECPSKADEDSDTWVVEYLQWLTGMTRDIKEGRVQKDEKIMRLISGYEPDIAPLWDDLATLSDRLEIIAHKQLRGVALTDEETRTIGYYGPTIAMIMLYEGNSYLWPDDDAPRVVDVYSNNSAKGYLHVGIARPRKLYVLYPWEGQPLLCVGAVMPYYEFVSPTRLTDSDWRTKLDSDQRPAIPIWASPIIQGGRLAKPKFK